MTGCTIRVLLPYDKLGLAAPCGSGGSVQWEEYREDGLYLEGIVKTEDLHCLKDSWFNKGESAVGELSHASDKHSIPAQLPDGSRVPPSGHLFWELPPSYRLEQIKILNKHKTRLAAGFCV